MTDPAGRQRDSAPHHGGSIPGTDGRPAFVAFSASGSLLPVVISVPHAGRDYPAALLAQMRRPADACLRLEDRLVDLLAQQVAAQTGATLVVARAPRAMIDLNRSPDDVDWEMIAGPGIDRAGKLAAGRRSRSGLGVVPRRLPGLGELWRAPLAKRDLDARIAEVHLPYHQRLAESLEHLRDRWGAALLVDLHSMPPLGAKRGPSAAPDFVIGDRFGSACDSALSAAALEYLAGSGHRVAHNRPYAGGYGLDRHAAPARGLHAMQVEVCRSIYLDSQLTDAGPGMSTTAQLLVGLVRRLAQELTACRGFAQAAE